MKELEYPFDSEYILKKAKSIKRTLLEEKVPRLQKKIAVLGGSTTHDIIKILDLFLFNQGIQAVFYESQYNQYWNDGMFPTDELISFEPDIIYIHTSNRNLSQYPLVSDTKEQIEDKLLTVYDHFFVLWEHIREQFHCPIVQCNFEYPFYRYMGNMDASDIHGRIHYLSELNRKFYQYAQQHEDFLINDINYLSACYGLDNWADPFYWHMYKYTLCMQAIPTLAFNISNIMKAVWGKNKKSLVLDLDNTIWGGIVGDDGVNNLEIGHETNLGQVFTEFQEYLKNLKEYGILLNVDSKNEMANALEGLNHPEGILKSEDFVVIKANWEPKSHNIVEIANEMNVLTDSLVFVDDNPAEREIVLSQIPGVAVPDIGKPEEYIRVLDHSGFFEVITLSEDDKKRNEMYKANVMRSKQRNSYTDYGKYLASLNMKATIMPFEPVYYARIAQLTNKSNQFNLTTKRYTQSEIELFATDSRYITLYGKLEDKFGDNGLVSVVIGEIQKDVLNIRLWLMSCRVLKRDMEYAMMDALVECAIQKDIKNVMGYYYPTAKNGMVQNFYELQGFSLYKKENQESIWMLDLNNSYQNKNHYIAVNGKTDIVNA